MIRKLSTLSPRTTAEDYRSATNQCESRVKKASEIVIADAIKLASMTVSRITGDARRVLGICRRVVELVESSKSTVKAPHIREVVQILQHSPTAGFLRDLSFHERPYVSFVGQVCET